VVARDGSTSSPTNVNATLSFCFVTTFLLSFVKPNITLIHTRLRHVSDSSCRPGAYDLGSSHDHLHSPASMYRGSRPARWRCLGARSRQLCLPRPELQCRSAGGCSDLLAGNIDRSPGATGELGRMGCVLAGYRVSGRVRHCVLSDRGWDYGMAAAVPADGRRDGGRVLS